MTATATQSTDTPLPADTAKALAQFTAAWLALRPYAPDSIKDALRKAHNDLAYVNSAEAWQHRAALPNESDKENYGGLEAFFPDRLKEFAAAGDVVRLTPDVPIEKLISDFVNAYHAFIETVTTPRVLVDGFFECFCELGNQAFTEQERDALAMRRMFNLI
ncbi:MAG: hypothetical protein HOP19_07535 [Acidobacteria bacterium]|nr:hypothetical protein [Acidobacteriota bacterium]